MPAATKTELQVSAAFQHRACVIRIGTKHSETAFDHAGKTKIISAAP